MKVRWERELIGERRQEGNIINSNDDKYEPQAKLLVLLKV